MGHGLGKVSPEESCGARVSFCKALYQGVWQCNPESRLCTLYNPGAIRAQRSQVLTCQSKSQLSFRKNTECTNRQINPFFRFTVS